MIKGEIWGKEYSVKQTCLTYYGYVTLSQIFNLSGLQIHPLLIIPTDKAAVKMK